MYIWCIVTIVQHFPNIFVQAMTIVKCTYMIYTQYNFHKIFVQAMICSTLHYIIIATWFIKLNDRQTYLHTHTNLIYQILIHTLLYQYLSFRNFNLPKFFSRNLTLPKIFLERLRNFIKLRSLSTASILYIDRTLRWRQLVSAVNKSKPLNLCTND